MAWAAVRRESEAGAEAVGWAKRSVPTIQVNALNLSVGGHGARSAFAHPT